MIYEARARLFFEEEDEATGFMFDCINALSKSIVLNPDKPNVEFGECALIENHHDEAANGPCVFIQTLTNDPDKI